MEFCTKHKRPKSDAEKGGGRRITETAGYIPMEVQINNLIRAGQKLKRSREEQYDFPDGKVVEDFLDVTRSPNFDMADAFQIQREVKARIRERRRAALEEKDRIEAAKKAEEPPAGDPPEKKPEVK